MPIISTIGRRSFKTRALVFTIYALLLVGAVSMVYPFLLMVAGSSKSNADVSESRLIPRFLVDDEALWIKHLEGLFNESLVMMRQVHNSDAPRFYHIDRKNLEKKVDVAAADLRQATQRLLEARARKSLEAVKAAERSVKRAERALRQARWALRRRLGVPTRVNQAMVDAWRAFLQANPQPHYAYTIGYISAIRSRGVIPRAMRQLKNELIERFDGDLDRLNRQFGTQFRTWSLVNLDAEDYLLRRSNPSGEPFALVLRDFKARQPIESRYYFTPDGAYKELLLKTRYSRRIEQYNREHGTNYKSYDEVHLDRRVPTGASRTAKEREDWLTFVRKDLNVLWIRADDAAAPDYRRFLEAKYLDIATLNQAYGTKYDSFGSVPFTRMPPDEGRARSDWIAFLEGWKDPDTGKRYILADEHLRVHSTEFLFRDYLEQRYGTLDKLNAELGTSYTRWIDIAPPQIDMHYLAFEQSKRALRWEFLVRNYITVWDYMVLHGRGVLNTAIYCILAVACALLVNPLAAYALSRYKPPSAYKILLFLMLTMAFPPMVTAIPTFLMLRQFNMLNTFWALILPGMANGYSIFLLKGFFDSLPHELYESAELDGAGEFRIFWRITMSLSKPILAVIALGAFNAAYANFMFALLICQDEKMWTLMVWLFQLRQEAGQGVIFASLLIAAIPTFMIFAFCQKIIMRGIVVPVEK